MSAQEQSPTRLIHSTGSIRPDIALATEARQFRALARQIETEAQQAAAFFLMSGVDLSAALATAGEERRRLTLRIERLLERERQKGARRHWSYDLNRHIALKQALDRLSMPGQSAAVAPGVSPGLQTDMAPAGAMVEKSQEPDPVTCACGRGPSSWPVANAPRHSSARPSDSRRRGPTSRDRRPASGRNGSSGAASAT